MRATGASRADATIGSGDATVTHDGGGEAEGAERSVERATPGDRRRPTRR